MKRAKKNQRYFVMQGVKGWSTGDCFDMNVDSIWSTKRDAIKQFNRIKRDDEGYDCQAFKTLVTEIELLYVDADGKVSDCEDNLLDTIVDSYEHPITWHKF